MNPTKYIDVQKFDKNITVAKVKSNLTDDSIIQDWSSEMLALADDLNASRTHGDSKPTLIVDYGAIDSAGSNSFGTLIRLHRRLNEMGGSLIIGNAEKAMGKDLRTVNLHTKILTMRSGTIEELVQAAQEPSRTP